MEDQLAKAKASGAEGEAALREEIQRLLNEIE